MGGRAPFFFRSRFRSQSVGSQLKVLLLMVFICSKWNRYSARWWFCVETAWNRSRGFFFTSSIPFLQLLCVSGKRLLETDVSSQGSRCVKHACRLSRLKKQAIWRNKVSAAHFLPSYEPWLLWNDLIRRNRNSGAPPLTTSPRLTGPHTQHAPN